MIFPVPSFTISQFDGKRNHYNAVADYFSKVKDAEKQEDSKPSKSTSTSDRKY